MPGVGGADLGDDGRPGGQGRGAGRAGGGDDDAAAGGDECVEVGQDAGPVEPVERLGHDAQVDRGKPQGGDLGGVAVDPLDVRDVPLDGEAGAGGEHAGLGVDGVEAGDAGRQRQGGHARAAAQVHGRLGAVEAEPLGHEREELVGVPGAEADVVLRCRGEQRGRVGCHGVPPARGRGHRARVAR